MLGATVIAGSVVAVAAFAYAVYLARQARADGARAQREKDAQAAQKTHEKWNKIESAPVDFKRAIERLRDRSNKN